MNGKGVEGITRNDKGEFLAYFGKRIEGDSAEMLEVLALSEAVLLVRRKRWSYVVLETNYKILIRSLCNQMEEVP